MFQHAQQADSHAKSAILGVAQTMQERQQRPQGDKRVHKEPAEDVIRLAPQRAAHNELLGLHPEQRRI